MNEKNRENTIPDWSSQWEYSTLGRVKNLLLELYLHISRIIQRKKEFRLIVLPCGAKDKNPASLLRAYHVGEALREHYGWRVTIIPPRLSLTQRLRIINYERPNIILMQMERHPLNRPELYSPYPVIFDIDDADFLWEHAREIVEECCKDSIAVIAGSHFVAEWASKYNNNVHVVWTGSPVYSKSNYSPQLNRKPIVAWGHSIPHEYPKESKFIEDILTEVAKKTNFEYWVFGVSDSNYAEQLRHNLSKVDIEVKLFEPMPFGSFTKQLNKVAVGLQVLSNENVYSKGKSFGKILNYLNSGVCVVASKGADHSLFFRTGENGMLVDTVDEWVDAIVWLLDNPSERQKISDNAYNDFQSKLSIKSVSSSYDRIFRDYIN